MKKPSNIRLATAKKTWWVLASFMYVMLFGTAWCAEQKTADKFNATEDNEDRVHETIHIRQAVSKSDSWLLYYLEYCWEWICNLPLIFVKWHAAYKFLPMEIEAYGHERHPEYINNDIVLEWIDIKKIPMKKMKELANLWYHGVDPDTGYPMRYSKSFSEFCETYIIPLVHTDASL